VLERKLLLLSHQRRRKRREDACAREYARESHFGGRLGYS
jgi:hypothetical protein